MAQRAAAEIRVIVPVPHEGLGVANGELSGHIEPLVPVPHEGLGEWVEISVTRHDSVFPFPMRG